MNSLELERVLTKLKFDESVLGYALITNDGQPFLSFSLPEEVFPQIKGTLKIHVKDLKLVNIMTGEGIVILARVDPKWVLAVLFIPDLTLGTAISRTNSVIELLEQVELPPPPMPIEEEVLETPEPVEEEVVMSPQPEPETLETIEPSSTELEEEVEIEVNHGCVVKRGSRYTEALTLDSELNTVMKRAYSNLSVDVLLIIDEKMTVYKIAGNLAKPVERVLNVVRWCFSEGIVEVDCPETQEPGHKEIVELPLFEGNLDKAKKEHRKLLALCDGTRTLQEISSELGIQYFQALQSILPYRGKSLRFIRTDKITGD